VTCPTPSYKELSRPRRDKPGARLPSCDAIEARCAATPLRDGGAMPRGCDARKAQRLQCDTAPHSRSRAKCGVASRGFV
jgi:hypothetical protein